MSVTIAGPRDTNGVLRVRAAARAHPRVSDSDGSAPDGAHAALGLPEIRAVDQVPGRLAPYRGAQQLGDLAVARAAAQRGAHVVLAVREPAGAELSAPGGQRPGAVAA